MSNVYITIVRTGKNEVTEAVPSGSTVRFVLEQAGIAASTFNDWAITDEDGDSLTLDSTLSMSTALICGERSDGAA